ncbi:hypothetical protein GCM10010187_08330 [Actinomadura coerulea]|nr:hypothetical protein GCM10010187_08330 [Actinomadura coerulea]
MLNFTDDGFKAAVQDEVGLKPDWSAEAFTDLDQDVQQSIGKIKADRSSRTPPRCADSCTRSRRAGCARSSPADPRAAAAAAAEPHHRASAPSRTSPTPAYRSGPTSRLRASVPSPNHRAVDHAPLWNVESKRGERCCGSGPMALAVGGEQDPCGRSGVGGENGAPV